MSENGFATGDTWYHGTSSALIASIQGQGLKRSGDKALNEAASKTMATIGNNYTRIGEPVFLTQSKNWPTTGLSKLFASAALVLVKSTYRVSGKFNGQTTCQVRPDVGAMSLLIGSVGEQFMAHLTEILKRTTS